MSSDPDEWNGGSVAAPARKWSTDDHETWTVGAVWSRGSRRRYRDIGVTEIIALEKEGLANHHR